MSDTVTEPNNENIIPEEHQDRVRKKVTLALIPWLALLYLMAFLDRANLSNAKYMLVYKNISVDENCTDFFSVENCTDKYVTNRGFISETDYGYAVSFFYITYTIFEVPSNLMMKKASAPTWISRIMISWGIVTVCTMFVSNNIGLFVCRFVLGACEAGFFPGVVYYMSFWFSPKELASKIAMFYMMNPLSLFFGGILSYGILQLDGQLNLHGWQWLYLLEGSPSIVVGILTFFVLPDKPENCKFLTEEEKTWLISYVNKQDTNTRIHCSDVARVFMSWKTWLFGIMYLFSQAIQAFVNFFLQALIGEFGFDGLISNLLSAPFYFFGVVCLMIYSYHSDKHGERPLHVVGSIVGEIFFWSLVALCYFYKANFVLLYIAVLLSVGWYYTFSPVFFAWASQIFKNDTSSAAATAFILSLGTSGQIWAPTVTSSIYVATGSYGWATVTLCGFGILGLIPAIILAISHKCGYLTDKYVVYLSLEEEEELQKKVIT